MGAQPRSIEWALAQPWPRYLIDHNNPWVFGQAFRLVGYATGAALELGLENEDDPVLIQYCGDHDLVWVTEDLDARRRGQYVAIVRDRGVSAVLLRPPSGRGWDVRMKFEVLARNMRAMDSALRAKRPRYFICTERHLAREVPSFNATFRPRRT